MRPLIIRVVDPAELELKLKSPSMVVDMETQREIYLDPEAAHQDMRRHLRTSRPVAANL